MIRMLPAAVVVAVGVSTARRMSGSRDRAEGRDGARRTRPRGMAARAGGVAEPMLSMRWPQLAACRSPQLRWATVLGCPHEISAGRIDCLWLSLCG